MPQIPSDCSIIQAVQYFWNSENSGKIRGPLVDQIGAASHIKRHQIDMDEKRFSTV